MPEYSMKNTAYVNDPQWNRIVDREIEFACLRGDLISVSQNPVATKALRNALDPSVKL